MIYVNYHYVTPWGRDLPEKLTVPQLLKKFPAFYGTRRFITVFTRAPPTCPYPEPDQSSPCLPIPLLQDPLQECFPSIPRSFQLSLSFRSPQPKTLYAPHLSPVRTTCDAHLIILNIILSSPVAAIQIFSLFFFTMINFQKLLRLVLHHLSVSF
jgi:hypothetical protein